MTGGAYCKRCGEARQDYLLNAGQCSKCLIGSHPGRFYRFVRVGRYRDALKRLVLNFKHTRVLDRFLGGMLADAIVGAMDPSEVDVWIPVPAHWRRRLAVGYQPTALLAASVARRFAGRVEGWLEAVRFVKPFHLQPRMSPSMRKSAISGAFRVRGGIDLHRKTVCLVDDVTTTGATLAEAQRVLRAAGVSAVVAAVIAKA